MALILTQVTAIYFHNEGNLQSLPHTLFISTQSLLPPHRQQNMAFESAKSKLSLSPPCSPLSLTHTRRGIFYQMAAVVREAQTPSLLKYPAK